MNFADNASGVAGGDHRWTNLASNRRLSHGALLHWLPALSFVGSLLIDF
jgi:hypothetical protein